MGMGMARVVRRAPPPKMLELVANPGYLHVRAAADWWVSWEALRERPWATLTKRD